MTDAKDREDRYWPTPGDRSIASWIGGMNLGHASVTRDQAEALARWLGVKPEVNLWITERPLPIRLRHPTGDLSSLDDFLAAGAWREVGRHVGLAGERLMGVLGPLLEPGEDPVAFVGRLLIAVGYDVPPELVSHVAASAEREAENAGPGCDTGSETETRQW